MFGFYRVGVAVPKIAVADVEANLDAVLRLIEESRESAPSVLLFPELTLTGYTAGDLFLQERLWQAQERAVTTLCERTASVDTMIVLGAGVLHHGRRYNCALVMQCGKILGIVPKSLLPNTKEFYEKRWFASGKDIRNETLSFASQKAIPFGVDLLFEDELYLSVGIELCEDLWSLVPPSLHQAASGATLLLNLSASNELIGKAAYRENLVRSQSARCVAAYAYASSGTGESSTDTVFGGDAMVAENGVLLCRSERFARTSQYRFADVDLQKLRSLRLAETSFADEAIKSYRRIALSPVPTPETLSRPVDPHPFVPSDPSRRKAHCEEIVAIQSHALLKRLEHTGIKKVVIGISGGLDSTLALLATHRAFEIAGLPSNQIITVSMPSDATTTRTKKNAKALCEALGTDYREVPIAEETRRMLAAIGHDSDTHDITYENTQARLRTSILMNMANMEAALVIGTGDLSEITLGWNTYNGDHMSMYAINASVPKTLVRYLIAYFAEKEPKLREILEDILDTPVSPELIPSGGDEIVQETEKIIGPYELHDFFLYHFIKYGAEPEKIRYLANIAFQGRYDDATIVKWLRLFLTRFFAQQFKRSAMPDGPKVGTVSLSPRADWRMPSDAVAKQWLQGLED